MHFLGLRWTQWDDGLSTFNNVQGVHNYLVLTHFLFHLNNLLYFYNFYIAALIIPILFGHPFHIRIKSQVKALPGTIQLVQSWLRLLQFFGLPLH